MDGVKLRHLVVDQALDIPERDVRVPVAAVVEFDALAQLEDPPLVIGGGGAPLCGKAPRQRRPPVGPPQIPIYEPVVDLPPHQTETPQPPVPPTPPLPTYA